MSLQCGHASTFYTIITLTNQLKQLLQYNLTQTITTIQLKQLLQCNLTQTITTIQLNSNKSYNNNSTQTISTIQLNSNNYYSTTQLKQLLQ